MTIMTYPAILRPVPNGYRVTFPDIPEASMLCSPDDNLPALAQECLWVALYYRTQSQCRFPIPSPLEIGNFKVDVEIQELLTEQQWSDIQAAMSAQNVNELTN